MADEGSVVPEDGMTDEDLSAKMQAMWNGEKQAEPEVEAPPVEGNEPTTETAVVEEPKAQSPEEMEEHRESSRLGRKMKGLEDRLAQMTALLERATSPAQQKVEPLVDEWSDLPEIIATKEDYFKLRDYEKRKEAAENNARQQNQNKYANEYLATIDSLSNRSITNEEHEAVVKELTNIDSPFNKMRTKVAREDAEINYHMVLAELRKPKSDEKKLPSRQTGGAPLTPAGNISKTSKESVSMPKVGKELSSLIAWAKSTGTTEAELAGWLK